MSTYQESTLMNAVTIYLHGGPWHGRKVALEEGRDHFHIIEPVEDAVNRALQNPSESDAVEVVKTREGTYSRISGMAGNFEWDGWRSHD